MPVRTLRIEVLGSSFTIQTDETPEYLREVVARFTRKTDEVRAASRVQDPLKVAVLAGLYLVDELERAKAGAKPDPGSGSAARRRRPSKPRRTASRCACSSGSTKVSPVSRAERAALDARRLIPYNS